MEQHELFVDKSIVELNDRIDTNQEKIDDVDEKFTRQLSEVHSYVDKRIEGVTANFPDTLARMGRDFDLSTKTNNAKLKSYVDDRLNTLPKLGDIKQQCDDTIKQCVQNGIFVEHTEMREITQRLAHLETSNNPAVGNREIAELRRDFAELKQKNADLEEALARQKAMAPTDTLSENDKKYWDSIRSKTETIIDDLPDIKSDLAGCKKTIQSLDIKSRRLNVIIDQLSEDDEEDTPAMVNKILDHAIPPNDRTLIEIVRAFRMGPKTVGSPPRKILIELSTPKGRDVFMDNARNIARVGNDGRQYYINEDLPDAVKRRKSDLNKYVNYLKRQGHKAQKIGDDVIVNGKRYKYEELNQLPVGQRLLDSRTIFNRGAVAFQSSVSPLSNLFPCKLKYQGGTYSSLEQCYQFHRATHHNRTELAALILQSNDPYTAMYHGKSIRDNKEWDRIKLGIMEQMLQHKADQCLMFRELLRFTGQHNLAENSWNFYWGTGCGFCGDAVWYGIFRGANHLGRLLMKIRPGI